MSTEREITSARIKETMEKKHVSYRELSELTNIAKSSLQRYVTNTESKIPMDNARVIAEKLGVSLSWLIGIEDNDQSLNHNKLDSGVDFSTFDQAMQFIIKSPVASAYGGYDLDKMSEEEVIDFANELSEMFKVMAKRHQK